MLMSRSSSTLGKDYGHDDKDPVVGMGMVALVGPSRVLSGPTTPIVPGAATTMTRGLPRAWCARRPGRSSAWRMAHARYRCWSRREIRSLRNTPRQRLLGLAAFR